MATFLQWLAASRARRVVFMAGFFPLPVFNMLSAALVVMTASARGPREALLDSGIALALVIGLGIFAGMDPVLLGLSAAASWLVWLGLGGIAGRSGSLTLAVQAAVLLALAAFVFFLVWAGDPVAFWSQLLEEAYADLSEQGLTVTVDIEEQAQLMTGVAFAGALSGTLLPLLLGLAWSGATRDEDFGAAFCQLNLGYVIGGMAAVAGVLAFAGLQLHGVLVIFGAAFAFQGAAVLAWWARRLEWPRAWWVALCVGPVVVAVLLVIELTLLAAVGFVDNWYGLRRKAD